MEDTFFSIKEAANILGCKKSTVYRLLADGWLKRPPGWGLKGESGRVSKKSLVQFMVIDCLSRLPAKTLRGMRNDRKHFVRIFSKIADAKCLSLDERTGKATEPCAPHSNRAQDSTGIGDRGGRRSSQRCLHHDYAEQHQFSFGWRARQLAPRDRAMQDDLVQEMSLAVLEFDQPASSEFLFELASNRAKNYLRYEAARGMLRLSEAREESDRGAEQVSRLNAFIGELLERGVPREWIEEALGARLEAA
jgi:excisionase family DNA binding protein